MSESNHTAKYSADWDKGMLWTGEKVSTNNMIILMMTFANMEKIFSLN